MSRRNRYGSLTLVLVAAAVFVLTVAVAAGIVISEYTKIHNANAAYQRNAEQDRRAAGDEIARACEEQVGAAFRACIGDRLENYYSDQTTDQGLQAQQDMAFWALMMVMVSGGTLVVTAVGVWLVVLNLREARIVSGHAAQANRHAARAAIAAQNSADFSRLGIEQQEETAIRQLRAYLSVRPASIQQLIGRVDAIGQIIVENVGQTPARNVNIQVRMRTNGLKTPPKKFFDFDSMVKFAVDRTIHPRTEVRQGSEEPYISISDLFKNKAGFVFVYGVVYFEDIFGRAHFTRYCHRYPVASRAFRGQRIGPVKSTRVLIEAEKARYQENGNNSD